MVKFIEFDLDTITSNLDKYCKEAIYTHYSEIKLINIVRKFQQNKLRKTTKIDLISYNTQGYKNEIKSYIRF